MRTGLLIIVGVLLATAVVLTFVGWRLRKHKKRFLSAICLLGTFSIVVLPVTQLFVFRPMNYRYIEHQRAKAEKAAIVGRDYEYVVDVLGVPKVTRYERPAIVISKDKTIRVVGEPYTALEYTMKAYLLGSPNLLVILGSDGRVTNFRYND